MKGIEPQASEARILSMGHVRAEQNVWHRLRRKARNIRRNPFISGKIAFFQGFQFAALPSLRSYGRRVADTGDRRVRVSALCLLRFKSLESNDLSLAVTSPLPVCY